MADTDTTTAEEPAGWNWVDTCGVLAGIALLVILADVFTDGRLISRHLRPAPPQPAEVPDE